MSTLSQQCIFRQLNTQPYEPVWLAMQEFTKTRTAETKDEIWLVEHHPVFTQGQAGKQEHILAAGDIPVVQVDRGGQVTYHGPGQQVVYFLIDLKRKKMGVRLLVTAIENTVIELLNEYNINAYAKADAPGVYVNEKKICSLGLKIKRSCSFHGLALNVNMDKEPFLRINPCGYSDLEVTQVSDLVGPENCLDIEKNLRNSILKNLNYEQFETGNKIEF